MEKEKVETAKLETDQQERMFTQSEVNELIKKRLERVKEKNVDTEELDKIKLELESLKNENSTLKVSQLRSKVAKEYRLPDQMVSRLQGTTEEELRADANMLAEMISSTGPVVLPLYSGSDNFEEPTKGLTVRKHKPRKY
nr:MAG TPA: Major head protein [Caudoviricetes sp.]